MAAEWMARRTWYWVLWVMRRPWIHRLQRASLGLMRPHRREAAWQGLVRQNRFARRYGLRTLQVTFFVMLASVLLTAAYMGCLWMFDSGNLGSGSAW